MSRHDRRSPTGWARASRAAGEGTARWPRPRSAGSGPTARAWLLPVATVTGATGAALRIRRLTARLQRRAVVAEAVADLSHRALSADQPDELLREALRVAVEVTRADYGTAVRRLPDGQMRLAQELGPQPLPTGSILPLARERSYLMAVVGSGRPFLSADLRSDPRISPPGPLLDRGVRSGLAVPVHGTHGVAGVLAVHSRHRNRFRAADVAVVGELAGVVATAWEQAAQRERLGHQALHDPLTGLANRALFLDRLEHALSRRPSPDVMPDPADVAVVLIDLDDFKAVNDSLGHAAGDHLLTVTAERFLEVVRPQDTLARLGGDEFALLCEPAPDGAALIRLAERMQGTCQAPVVVAGTPVTVSASFGISRSGRGSAPRSAKALVGEADAALYGAKDRGGGRIQVFDDRLQRSRHRRRLLEAELQAALENEEFVLHYQPVRSAGDLHAVGVEALLRWQHPTQGLLPPAQFLRAAEDAGMLPELGRWILRTACRQAAGWIADASAEGRPDWVAVNVSARQLEDPALGDVVASLLEESGLPPRSLALEVTESALVGCRDHGAALHRVREAGARLVLDDFGTGASSLTHLTDLPLDAVKVDRSSVAALPDDRRGVAVAQALVTLGAQLGLDVVAEGVETAGQLELLRRLGCPGVQGYLLDRPAPEPDLAPSAPRFAAG